MRDPSSRAGSPATTPSSSSADRATRTRPTALPALAHMPPTKGSCTGPAGAVPPEPTRRGLACSTKSAPSSSRAHSMSWGMP
jgi:hypothetical protein